MANDAELRIGGNVDDLKSAARQGQSEISQFADKIQSSMGELNSLFSKTFATDSVSQFSDGLEQVDTSIVQRAVERLNATMETLHQDMLKMLQAIEHQGEGFLKLASQIGGMVVAGKAALDIVDRLAKPKAVMPGVGDSLRTATAEVKAFGDSSRAAFATSISNAEAAAISLGSRLKAALETALAAARAAIPTFIALGVALAPIALIAMAVYAAIKILKEGFDILVNGGLAGGALEATSNRLSKAAHEVETLADKLGAAQPHAQALAEVLSQAGKSTDDYIAGNENLRKALLDNEKEFNSFGIATRDSSGHLRNQSEIAGDTTKALKKLADDGSRAWQMNKLGVSSMKELEAVAAATPESIVAMNEKLAEYRVLIGNDAVQATERYEAALRKYKAENDLTWRGVSNMISQAVMPAFTDLLEWFTGGMPSIAQITHSAMTIVMKLWYGFVNTVTAAKECAIAAIGGIGDALVGLSKAAEDLKNGQIKQAYDRLGEIKEAAAARFAEANRKVLEQEEQFAARLRTYATAGSADQAQPVGGKNTGNRVVHSTSGTDDKSRMSAWEAELAAAKVHFQKVYELREYSKEQERDYWKSIIDNVTISETERVAITKKVSELELEIMKKKIQQKRALDAESIDAIQKEAEDGIKLAEMAYQREYELGNINKQQLLSVQEQFENKRFEIQQEAQAARIAAMLGDPNMDPVALQKLLDQMAEIQRKHAMNVTKIQTDMAVESRMSWEQALSPIGSAFEKSITGMIQGTLTFKKAISNIFNSILGEFVNLCVKMGVKWAAKEAANFAVSQGFVSKELAVKLGLMSAETAAQTSASTATAVAKKAEADATIPAEAAEAAGAAASAVAGIPIVGPELAADAFAETMAMVMGGLSVASASGGFDIPAGVNPMTQLHEEEMVLPSKYANAIRSMADGSPGGQSQAPKIEFNVINETGQAAEAKPRGGMQFDGEKYIQTVVFSMLETNNRFRTELGLR